MSLSYTIKEKEQKYIRTRIALFAMAYEHMDTSLVSDSEYDQLALMVDTTIDTDRPDLDEFFRTHYTADSGMWIVMHPDFSILYTMASGMIDYRSRTHTG